MSSKSKTQSTQTTALDPKLDSTVYGNVDRATNLANGYQPYTGPLVAGFNEAQGEAQSGLRQFASSNVGGGLLGQAQTAAQGILGYQPANVNAQQVQAGQLAGTDLNPYMNPYQSSVIDSTLGQYDRQNQIDLNNARGRAASAGAFGGSGSALLQSQAQEANGRTLASTLAGLNQANFSQAQNAAQSDIAGRNQAAFANQGANLTAQQGNQQAGLANNAQQMQLSGILSGLSDQQRAQALQSLGILSGVGDVNQQQQQAEFDAQHQAYMDQNSQQMAYQQLINQSLGLVPQTGTTNTSGTSKTSPGLTGILQGIGSAAQGIGAIASDERLKADIQTVAFDAEGRRWVDYRYVWEPEGVRPYRGLIAQELRKTHPHAVLEHPSGFLMIDYGALI